MFDVHRRFKLGQQAQNGRHHQVDYSLMDWAEVTREFNNNFQDCFKLDQQAKHGQHYQVDHSLMVWAEVTREFNNNLQDRLLPGTLGRQDSALGLVKGQRDNRRRKGVLKNPKRSPQMLL